MEVCFRPDMGHPQGLRAMTREQLDLLCLKAKCTILHSISNNHLDAYVLSESSLFVYKHRLVMKTCGTTTLLRCLSNLLEFADALGLELTWVGYSRKNLLYPTAQLWPHSNFGDEIRYIDTHEKLQSRLEGNGHILGPITGE
jgi:S-adenosylmethionine decarboxylase